MGVPYPPYMKGRKHASCMPKNRRPGMIRVTLEGVLTHDQFEVDGVGRIEVEGPKGSPSTSPIVVEKEAVELLREWGLGDLSVVIRPGANND